MQKTCHQYLSLTIKHKKKKETISFRYTIFIEQQLSLSIINNTNNAPTQFHVNRLFMHRLLCKPILSLSKSMFLRLWIEADVTEFSYSLFKSAFKTNFSCLCQFNKTNFASVRDLISSKHILRDKFSEPQCCTTYPLQANPIKTAPTSLKLGLRVNTLGGWQYL